jgi:hypothetical protein
MARPPEPFEQLALDIHRYQVARCPVIQSLTDHEPTQIQDIPAVPVGLYKDFPIGTVGPDQAKIVFGTSGTTGGGRGLHRMRSAALYHLSASTWARHCLGGWPRRSVNVLVDPAIDPLSSLSHMVAHLAPDASWHLDSSGVDAISIRAALRDEPVFVGATAFALADWLAGGDLPVLPPGSLLMVTGGFKGRIHRLDDATLLAHAKARLRPDRLVTEYGMTELSSQLWGEPGGRYRPPPWLRVLAVDPASGAVLPPGVAGQLRFIDLANLDASVAIETLDGGVVDPDGTVELFGRLPGAPARGCSLTVEEVWEARSRSLT